MNKILNVPTVGKDMEDEEDKALPSRPVALESTAPISCDFLDHSCLFVYSRKTWKPPLIFEALGVDQK